MPDTTDSLRGTLVDAAADLSACVAAVDPARLEALADAVHGARAVFVCGAGRSLLVLRCLAMRLMHLGYTAHVVGDVTCPAFGPGDLLLCASGSGETEGTVRRAVRVRTLGGTVAALTIEEGSALGRAADVVVPIPGFTDKRPLAGREGRPTLPGGSLFEEAVLLVGDSLVVPLAERQGVPVDRAFSRHANLE